MIVVSKPSYYDLLTIAIKAFVNIILNIYYMEYILLLGPGTSINLCCFGNIACHLLERLNGDAYIHLTLA